MDRTWEERTKAKIRVLSDLLNDLTLDEKEVAKGFANEHRTLQQTLTRLCVAWLEELAKAEHFDLRNEASVQLAKKFVERFPITERYLPLV